MRWPDLAPSEVAVRVGVRWDLSGPLPVPRDGWLRCAICGSGDIQPRWWRFHQRSGPTTIRGRCDVSFKCCDCSALLPTFGVALADADWQRMSFKPGRQIHWRDARRILGEA